MCCLLGPGARSLGCRCGQGRFLHEALGESALRAPSPLVAAAGHPWCSPACGPATLLSACVSQGRGRTSAASMSSSSASASLRLLPDTVPFTLAAALFDSGFWLHLLFGARPGSPLWGRVFRDLLQRELELDVGLFWLPSVTTKHRRDDLGLGLLALLKSWFFRLLHGLPREPPSGRIVEQVVSLIPRPVQFRAGRRLMECLGPCDCGHCWARKLRGPLGGWREHRAGWMRDAVKASPPQGPAE